MENDLISRSVLLQDVDRSFNAFIQGAYFSAACDAIRAKRAVIRMLNDAPAIDAEPVRHGRWIMRGGRFRCFECDAVALQKDEGGTGGFSHEYVYVKSSYCPNCGAKMDTEDNHETLDPEPS